MTNQSLGIQVEKDRLKREFSFIHRRGAQTMKRVLVQLNSIEIIANFAHYNYFYSDNLRTFSNAKVYI